MSYQSNPHLKEACDSEIYSLIFAPHSWLPNMGLFPFKLVQRYHPVGFYDSARWIEGIYPLFVTQYAAKIVHNHLDFMKFVSRTYPEISSNLARLLDYPFSNPPEKITVLIPPKSTCSVTYLRKQFNAWYRSADHITIYCIVRENTSNSDSQTVEIELTNCVMNSLEIAGGTIIDGNHPNLLLSDLSSVVSNFCSQWENYTKYISTDWQNHYQIIQFWFQTSLCLL